jgi:hypothetical protein
VSYSNAQRKHLQAIIEKAMIDRLGSTSFTNLTDEDLNAFFNLYDKVFFGSTLARLEPRPLARCMENSTSHGKGVLGVCLLDDNAIEINATLLVQALGAGVLHEICNGTVCRTRMSVLQSVLEHEIVHMIVHNSCFEKSSHGKHFLAVASKIFGHTSYTHMIGHRQNKNINLIGNIIANRTHFKEGDTVTANRNDDGTFVYTGIIKKLNPKKAVVTLTTGVNKGSTVRIEYGVLWHT